MMLLKQFSVDHKIWLHAGSAVLIPVKSVALLSVTRLKQVIKIEIPDGYQDKQGFHFGVKPAAKQNRQPVNPSKPAGVPPQNKAVACPALE